MWMMARGDAELTEQGVMSLSMRKTAQDCSALCESHRTAASERGTQAAKLGTGERSRGECQKKERQKSRNGR
jgi:hypothetical protein